MQPGAAARIACPGKIGIGHDELPHGSEVAVPTRITSRFDRFSVVLLDVRLQGPPAGESVLPRNVEKSAAASLTWGIGTAERAKAIFCELLQVLE